jgi:hypothetical protein
LHHFAAHVAGFRGIISGRLERNALLNHAVQTPKNSAKDDFATQHGTLMIAGEGRAGPGRSMEEEPFRRTQRTGAAR